MTDIKQKISAGEGEKLDFKFRIDDQKKIARTLAAFSNTSGGSLLIGVKDNGKISGCDPEEEYYMIQGAAELFCFPPVEVKSHTWIDGHHIVLEVSVNASYRLIKSVDENGKLVPYYRLKDKTVKSNKVLDLVWRLKKNGADRPEQFTDKEIEVLRMISSEGSVSISRLNRESGLGFNELTRLIASLIHWKVLGVRPEDDGLRYYCIDYQE